METLKSVIGLGKTEPAADESSEPVSGQQGEGTAAQPFDAGNNEGTTAPFLAVLRKNHPLSIDFPVFW